MISLIAVTTNTLRIGRCNTALVSAFTYLAGQTNPITTRSSSKQPQRFGILTLPLSTSSFSILSKQPSSSPSYYRHQHHYQQKHRRTATSLPSSEEDEDTSSTGKARVLFLGTPDVAATSLRTLVDASKDENSCYELVGVVTQPPKRRKRRGKVIPSPVGLVAEELDIPVLCPEKAKDPEFLDELENEVRPDLCITAAYGQYLPKRFLAIPKFGTLNIHPSLLPRWRGASPVQRSLQAGDNPLGVSVLFTVQKMDAGPIVSQSPYPVDDATDNATNLLPALFERGTECLINVIPGVVNGKVTMEEGVTVQDENDVVDAEKIAPEEGLLVVWEDGATVCHNKVRGFSMWPGTFIFCHIGDEELSEENPAVKMKVLESRVLDDCCEPTDEIVLGPKKGDGLRLVCGDGSILELLRVQPATRNAMDAKSFMNGLRGARLRWTRN